MINYFWEFVIFEVIPFYFFFSQTLHLSCSFPFLHSSKSLLPTSPLPQIRSFSISLQRRAGLCLRVQICVYTWHGVPVQGRDNLTSWSSPVTLFEITCLLLSLLSQQESGCQAYEHLGILLSLSPISLFSAGITDARITTLSFTSILRIQTPVLTFTPHTVYPWDHVSALINLGVQIKI